jgi:hypothetical protein
MNSTVNNWLIKHRAGSRILAKFQLQLQIHNSCDCYSLHFNDSLSLPQSREPPHIPVLKTSCKVQFASRTTLITLPPAGVNHQRVASTTKGEAWVERFSIWPLGRCCAHISTTWRKYLTCPDRAFLLMMLFVGVTTLSKVSCRLNQ